MANNIGDPILLLEGLNDGCSLCSTPIGNYSDSYGDVGYVPTRRRKTKERSTKKMARRRCIRKATYYNRYGQPVRRCAKFSDSGSTALAGREKRGRRRKKFTLFGGSSLGQGGILKDLQPTLITGGLAAGGAWISQSLASKLGKSLNVQPGSMTGNLLTIAVGVALGGLVTRFTKKREMGVALGVGAVAITLLNFIGTLSPTAGLYGNRLGIMTAEPAPYYQPAAQPPVMEAVTASNLYTDAGVAAIV